MFRKVPKEKLGSASGRQKRGAVVAAAIGTIGVLLVLATPLQAQKGQIAPPTTEICSGDMAGSHYHQASVRLCSRTISGTLAIWPSRRMALFMSIPGADATTETTNLLPGDSWWRSKIPKATVMPT
jgi:hypothetical protein